MAKTEDDDLDNEALVRQLGDSDAPQATTMPVTPPVAAQLPAAAAPPVAAQLPAPTAPPAAADPWTKGQIVGGARAGADFARLGGGFGSADTDSLKHTFGRIAQNFEHNPAGLTALMQDEEFKRLFPKASVSKDWIDFGGQFDPHTGTNVGKVDVMHAWDPAMGAGHNKNWQWLTEEEALAGGPNVAAAPAAGKDNQAANAALGAVIGGGGEQSDARTQLDEELQALINGGASPAEAQALLQQLQ